MRKSRFTDSQIMAILKQAEAGLSVRELCREHGITLVYTQPGKPTQNAFIERLYGIYRRAVLDAWCFLSISHVREETERWRVEYNTIRPHQSLGDVSAIEFLTHRGHSEIAINGWY